MRNRLLFVAVCLATAALATPSAQSDLDQFMSRVLSRRDENWKKLQQYTLRERETVQITALTVFRLYGFEREYLWFPRAGFFIRSPLEADGVKIAEDDRVRQEERWLRRAQSREERIQRPRERKDRCSPATAQADTPPEAAQANTAPPDPEPSPTPSPPAASKTSSASRSSPTSSGRRTSCASSSTRGSTPWPAAKRCSTATC
jgi:hypothetical protein